MGTKPKFNHLYTRGMGTKLNHNHLYTRGIKHKAKTPPQSPIHQRDEHKPKAKKRLQHLMIIIDHKQHLVITIDHKQFFSQKQDPIDRIRYDC